MFPPDPPETKKKRASRPKARTGCKTCKYEPRHVFTALCICRARRVKCDEMRPICGKCSRFGHKCLGYDEQPIDTESRTRTRIPARQFLLPKSSGTGADVCPMYESIFTVLPFRDERENQYFGLFRDKLARQLSAGFELTLWTQLVLQACETDAIRQLTVATAAMRTAQDTVIDKSQSILHRKYALEVYGYALKGVQSLLVRGEDIRASLIATLLIFVFESMQGGSERAAMSIQSALRFMNYRVLPKSPEEKEDHVIGIYEKCETNRSLVENEVLKAFIRLDRPAIGLLTRDRDTGKSKPWALSSKWFNSAYEIPFTFQTIDEARYCYERIRFRVFPEDLFENKIQNSANIPRGPSAPALILKHLFAETTDCSTAPILRHELRAWHRAFAPLLEYSRTPAGDSTFIPASTLLIGASALDLPLHMIDAGAQSRPIQDSACEAARNVIMLSKAQVTHPDFTFGFVLEMGIIIPLWMVIVLCPGLQWKREAIKVLRSMEPRIECVWDSRAVADAGDEIVRDAEEQATFMAAMVAKCSESRVHTDLQ
ncbi:hypothetical protein VTL71DRAFT_13218 [Oculimacula yallundae]|uniref:Zn(2)-C6 fungal-type domain-containing protein n=1 Tax=Oculimacula yallundae TaxID=86028 RepID=A0ABR4CJQ5_9HELO